MRQTIDYGLRARAEADTQRLNREAALAFVLDSTAELLAAMRRAGIGTDNDKTAVRRIRSAASRAQAGEPVQ